MTRDDAGTGDRVGSQRWRQVLDLAVVAAVGLGVGLLFDLLGLPSPALFGGMVAGLVRALAFPAPPAVPEPASTASLAVVGVAIGALVDPGTLRQVGEAWLPVLLVIVATLAMSLVAGLLLRLRPGISPVTGAFSMIAGGATGITAMAGELGADARMVAVLQYLRVLLIVSLMPVTATVVYGATSGGGGADGGTGAGWPVDLLFTVACSVVGLVLARLLRIPAGSVLGPMVVTAAVDLSGLGHGATVPGALQALAFLVIGLQVGLNFSRQSLRTIGAALPLALAIIAVLIVACAGLGVLLASATGAQPLDAYLATTPGGMTAVLATATDSGADATFVLAVQVARLFVMVLSAPLIARWLRRSRPTP
jgi:membrane AbrB-like protein